MVQASEAAGSGVSWHRLCVLPAGSPKLMGSPATPPLVEGLGFRGFRVWGLLAAKLCLK